MVWKDGRKDYGVVSRINHWLGALSVIVLLAIGIYFHEMPQGDERLFWMRLHMGLGVLAIFPLAFRIGWRWAASLPEPLSQTMLLTLATRAVHGLLLLGIAALLLSGPFIVWSAGVPVEVFGLFALPSPTGRLESLHNALETLHAFIGKVLLPLIVVHVLGALKHALFDGSGRLRMFRVTADP